MNQADPGTQATTPVRTYERVFPGTLREARQFLAAALDGCPAADDAVLCVSELAANCALHSSLPGTSPSAS